MEKGVIITILSIILAVAVIIVVIMFIITLSNNPAKPTTGNIILTPNNAQVNNSSIQEMPSALSKTSNYTITDCYDICSYVYNYDDSTSLITDCQGKCGLYNQQADLDRYTNFVRALKK